MHKRQRNHRKTSKTQKEILQFEEQNPHTVTSVERSIEKFNDQKQKCAKSKRESRPKPDNTPKTNTREGKHTETEQNQEDEITLIKVLASKRTKDTNHQGIGNTCP